MFCEKESHELKPLYQTITMKEKLQICFHGPIRKYNEISETHRPLKPQANTSDVSANHTENICCACLVAQSNNNSNNTIKTFFIRFFSKKRRLSVYSLFSCLHFVELFNFRSGNKHASNSKRPTLHKRDFFFSSFFPHSPKRKYSSCQESYNVFFVFFLHLLSF